jgi:hypothetical protein
MAITPNECDRMTAQELEVLCLWEKRIDDQLQRRFGSSSGQVAVYLDRSVTPKVREELMRRYEGAGWIVGHDSCQREGHWLTFRPKSSPIDPDRLGVPWKIGA